MRAQERWAKWIQLLILSLGGGVIYQLPYLRFTFYTPLLNALNLNDQQLGLLASAYGIISIGTYFPGGWLADKFPARILIAFSLISNGLFGFYFSSFPSYPMNLLLHFLWPLVTILTYWATLIKSVGELGEKNEKGRIYGLFEGARGLISTLLAFISLTFFSHFLSEKQGLQTVILFYSGLSIIIGVISYFLLGSNPSSHPESKSTPTPIQFQDLIAIIKMDKTWLISGMIFTTYSLFLCQTYLSPYLVHSFGMTVKFSVILGAIRTHLLQLIGGPLGGGIADRLKSPSKLLQFGFVILALNSALFLRLLTSPEWVILVIINMVILGLVCFSMKSVFFATIDEASFPSHTRGCAVGLISCIGFSPDIFLPPLIGHWLNQYPGDTGYRILFISMLAMMVLGILASILFRRSILPSNIPSSSFPNLPLPQSEVTHLG